MGFFFPEELPRFGFSADFAHHLSNERISALPSTGLGHRQASCNVGHKCWLQLKEIDTDTKRDMDPDTETEMDTEKNTETENENELFICC